MASSSSANPRGKRTRDEQPRQPVLGHENYNTAFEDAAHGLKARAFSRRINAAQKFVDIPTLRTLYVYEGVKTMFENIRWGGILKLGALSYGPPTWEFLSSLTHDKRANTISFRLLSQSHTMHVDQLCAIINAPTDHRTTFGVGESRGYAREKRPFWEAITGRGSYTSSNAKASLIVHPVMKVCYRILANVVFPQEDSNKVAQKELELLWCMANRQDKTPHFGKWIIYKLVKLSKSSSGPLHCGGIVTIIATHLGLRIPQGLEPIPGERLITVRVLTNAHVLTHDKDTTYWIVNDKDYLEIEKGNKSLLKLQKTTSQTNWFLPSNIGARLSGSNSESEEEDEADEGHDNQGGIPSSSRPSSSNIPSSSDAPIDYTQMQMGEVRRLFGYCRTLNESIEQCHDDIEAVDGDVRDMRYMLEDHITTQQAHNDRVNAFMAQQAQQQSSMHSMIQSLFDVHIGGQSSYSAPSSSQQYPDSSSYPQQDAWGNWGQNTWTQQQGYGGQQPPQDPNWRPWP